VIQEEESNRTWDALEAQEKAANDQLAAISKLRGELEQKRKERDQLAGHIELLKATQQGLERKEKDLELRGKALELLTTALEGVEGKHDQAQENVLGAKALVDTAEKVLSLAQQEEKRAALTGQITSVRLTACPPFGSPPRANNVETEET
jgi:chromosome segregation ATPase